MDSKLAELVDAQVARRQMVRTTVNETTSNSRCKRSRNSTLETGATRFKTTSSTLSPSTGKSDCSLFLFSLQKLLNLSFHSASSNSRECDGRVNITPTCTHTDAHFSRAHTTVHNSHVGKKNLCRAFLCTHFHLVVMSLLNGPLVRFPPVASSPSCCSLSRPSASSTSLERSRVNPCASAHWSGMSGCLANPTPHTHYGEFSCELRFSRSGAKRVSPTMRLSANNHVGKHCFHSKTLQPKHNTCKQFRTDNETNSTPNTKRHVWANTHTHHATHT